MVAYSFRRRFVEPIRDGTKRQTMRAHRSRHARPGETMQLYCGQRTRYCFKIVDVTCKAVDRIALHFVAGAGLLITLNGKLLGARRTRQFVRGDGFDNVADFRQFWFREHGAVDGMEWEGVVLRW
jgi:hypothetical protein